MFTQTEGRARHCTNLFNLRGRAPELSGEPVLKDPLRSPLRGRSQEPVLRNQTHPLGLVLRTLAWQRRCYKEPETLLVSEQCSLTRSGPWILFMWVTLTKEVLWGPGLPVEHSHLIPDREGDVKRNAQYNVP